MAAELGSNARSCPVLVLASASEARARILADAGVPFVHDPSAVDESAIKEACRREGVPADDAAIRLAEAKALQVAGRRPGDLVLGADQLLDCDGVWFDKPLDKAGARATLLAIRGRRHRLISAVVAAQGERIVWRHVAVAVLTMREYSDRFIAWYLSQATPADWQVVGACRLEGIGSQAFAAVDGDYFTILGLPLLPLLAFLRRQDVLIA